MESWETFDEVDCSREKPIEFINSLLSFKDANNSSLLHEECISTLTELCHQLTDALENLNIPSSRSKEFLLEGIQNESLEENLAEILRNVTYALDHKVRLVLKFMKELENNNENLQIQSSLLTDQVHLQSNLDEFCDHNERVQSEINLLEQKLQDHERKMEEFSENKRILEGLISNQCRELALKDNAIQDLEEENNRLMAELIDVTEKLNQKSSHVDELIGQLNDEKELREAHAQRCENLDACIKQLLNEEKTLTKEKSDLENKVNKKIAKRKSADGSLLNSFFRE